ncbi:MAG TPA: Hsp70 family protein [Mesorhizobium sp.]|nr:Hsp70 family protein [Mesorhizobium sp.]
MPHATQAPPLSVGIDFGTSNTVVAVAGPNGHARAVTFDHRGERLRVYATALCFWDERKGASAVTRFEGGPFAIEQFLEGADPHRFLQSFKTFAGSASFQETRIFRERFRFEDLLAAFLRTLLRHADDLDLREAPRVVVGRPVRFAGRNPDDALAISRYRAAFERLGAGHARYVYEPVGAAFFYAAGLERDATVLVADFGGGTSDFSVMHFSRKGGQLAAEPLGHAGVGVAGDAFDARMVDRVVAPRLGKGGHYRGMGGKLLSIPNHYYGNLSRWNDLALMKSSGDLKDLRAFARTAMEPEPLEAFAELVEEDQGFALYRAVSKAKVALSTDEETSFQFRAGGLPIEARITRPEFEAWIAPDVVRITAGLDEALGRSGVPREAIDRVFLTGGTSFVPAIRRSFIARFGEERLTSANQFEAIAYGLALIGQSPEPELFARPDAPA